jgi:hypothetical protein
VRSHLRCVSLLVVSVLMMKSLFSLFHVAMAFSVWAIIFVALLHICVCRIFQFAGRAKLFL